MQERACFILTEMHLKDQKLHLLSWSALASPSSGTDTMKTSHLTPV